MLNKMVITMIEILKWIQNLLQQLHSYQNPLSSLSMLPKRQKNEKVMNFPSFATSWLTNSPSLANYPTILPHFSLMEQQINAICGLIKFPTDPYVCALGHMDPHGTGGLHLGPSRLSTCP